MASAAKTTLLSSLLARLEDYLELSDVATLFHLFGRNYVRAQSAKHLTPSSELVDLRAPNYMLVILQRECMEFVWRHVVEVYFVLELGMLMLNS